MESNSLSAANLLDDVKCTMQQQDKLDNLPKITNIENANSGVKLFIGMILDCLTPELCRVFILSVLDCLDQLVKKTDNKVDDVVVNAITTKIRSLLNVESPKDPTIDSKLTADQKLILNEQVNNLVTSCDTNIQTGSFKMDSNTGLFDNISETIKHAKYNPFEK